MIIMLMALSTVLFLAPIVSAEWIVETFGFIQSFAVCVFVWICSFVLMALAMYRADEKEEREKNSAFRP